MTTPNPADLEQQAAAEGVFLAPAAPTEPEYRGKDGRVIPGVPSDYFVNMPLPRGITLRRGPQPEIPRYPQYSYGQEYSTFAYLSPEATATIQRRLIEANLLSNPDATPTGVWTPEYALAMRDVMNWADWTGTTWDKVLTAWETNPIIPDEQTAKYTPTVYAAPDYDSIVMDVKDTFRSRLGRDPQQGELDALAGTLSTSYREAYEAAETYRRAEFERSQTGETGTAPTVEQVDPVASFRSVFEDRYQPELNMLRRQDELATNRNLLQQSFSTSEKLIP